MVKPIVANKVENAIPLERQARMFSNDGLSVAPSMLGDLYKPTADALLPLYERMVDRIMQCDILPRLNSTPAGQIDSLIPGAKQRRLCRQ